MTIQRILIALPLALSFAGCGTIATHLLPPSERPPGVTGVYRGMKFDSFMLSGMATNKEAEVWGYTVVFAPVFICDLPLSAVADTLFLPFDAFSNDSTNTP